MWEVAFFEIHDDVSDMVPMVRAFGWTSAWEAYCSIMKELYARVVGDDGGRPLPLRARHVPAGPCAPPRLSRGQCINQIVAAMTDLCTGRGEARPRRRRSLRRRRAQRDGLLDAPPSAPSSGRPRPRARHPQARDRAQTIRAHPIRARRIHDDVHNSPCAYELEGASPGVRPSPPGATEPRARGAAEKRSEARPPRHRADTVTDSERTARRWRGAPE